MQPGDGAKERRFARTVAAQQRDELAARDPKLAELVDLRYFCGYTFEEIAAQRGTSIRTVKREWEKARAYLFHELKGALPSADACRSIDDQ